MTYQRRITSLDYRIQMALRNPQPILLPLTEVFPASGSTVSVEDLRLRYPGGACFYLENPIQDLISKEVHLLINDENLFFWTGEPAILTTVDDWGYCFLNIKFVPGNYLFDLTVEELGIDHYQWAFTFTDN